MQRISDNNLSHAPRIKRLNNQKNTALMERNSFMAYHGMPGLFLDIIRGSKTNGKDMFDCFINIYADTVLAEWYIMCTATVCKYIAM